VPLWPNNQSFQDVNLLGGSLASGTLTLAPIGTSSNQRYLFTGNFTVASGAALTFAAGSTIVFNPSVTLTDNGTLTITNAAAVTAVESNYSTFGITVNGVMNVTNTLFTHNEHLRQFFPPNQLRRTSHCLRKPLRVSSMVLASGSVLNAGDLTNNTFDSPCTSPPPMCRCLLTTIISRMSISSAAASLPAP